LRRRFARFELRADFLKARSELFNLFLQILHLPVLFEKNAVSFSRPTEKTKLLARANDGNEPLW
jgi:hypothetical protein